MNGGVVSSIFCSSLLFTMALFWYWYGQTVSRNDLAGTFLIITCILLIAFGGLQTGDAAPSVEEDVVAKVSDTMKKEQEEKNLNVAITIVLALVTGMAFTYNTVTIEYCIRNGFDLNQASYDANLVLFIPFFIMYMVELKQNGFPYTVMDTVAASAQMTLITLGIICFSFACQFGKAAPVQAVENSKAIVQMILGIIIMKRYPNAIQGAGVAAGVIGVLVIVLQNKKGLKKEDQKGEIEVTSKVEEKNEKANME